MNAVEEERLEVFEAADPSQGESPFGPLVDPAALHRACAGSHRYPRSAEVAALEQQIAAYHGARADQVVLGAGSIELLHRIPLAFPAPRVITCVPCFPALPERATLLGREVIYLRPEARELDLEALERHATRDSIVLICSPNNPGGRLTPFESIRRFVQRVDSLVVVDEAYGEYVVDDQWESAIAITGEVDRLIVTRTFSKIHGLAGLRIGYAVASPGLAARLRAFDSETLGTVAVRAASVALAAHGRIEQVRHMTLATRERLLRGLDALGLEVWPSQAPFVRFRAPTSLLALAEARGIPLRRTSPTHDGERIWVDVAVVDFAACDRLLQAVAEAEVRSAAIRAVRDARIEPRGVSDAVTHV